MSKKDIKPIKQKIKSFTREKSVVSKMLRNTHKSLLIFELYALENVQFFEVSTLLSFTCTIYYNFFPTAVGHRINCLLLVVWAEIKTLCIFTLKTNEKITAFRFDGSEKLCLENRKVTCQTVPSRTGSTLPTVPMFENM